ncbi:cob(II)yrinic acid a,c-diamide reductase [Kribbella sp. VKM Ac-2527]|uniref:Cob(II)yrinic acid a,c-diamide reductase n=1 Tax=Kribbella caucasensis TaxID=2512215 RepID=A0A4R6KHX1_9ACTN|nr:5,6-dimethylbenzimidazole synthase [Kribbella sp. VKM Ac-2527]TDO50107.1 cob(II)yrinic acid a,c-diamide reductase [Kribbella sp. VKM Ac-2527]
MLVIGIGLRSGTSYRELRDLVDTALDGLDRGAVGRVVTVDGKESETGLQRLVASLGAELFTASALDLSRQPVPSPSDQVGHLIGTASVAEAAVILSGAELVVPKQRSARATVAVGRLPFVDGTAAAPGYALRDRDVVHRVIAERRDVRRGFLDQPIADDVLTRVLESAHRAPSVGLSQPWDFVLIRDVATRRKIRDLAVAQRDAFAASLPVDRRAAFDGLKVEAILDTPLNIAVTCDPGRGGRHVLGRHADPRTTWFSAAIAVQNLWLAARAEGLGVGWVSFFEPGEVAAVLDLPAHVELLGYLCVGQVDEFAAAPELVRSGWAARRPLAWAVHHEAWGQRGLPGETASRATAVQAAVNAAVDAVGEAVATDSRRVARVVVVEGGAVEDYLTSAEVLVVQVGAERPAADFGVLWRPARQPDEAVELGVEVARDLVLQGAGELLVDCPGESELAESLAQGLRWGGLACGVAVRRVDEPGR